MMSITEPTGEHIPPDCLRCRRTLDEPSVALTWSEGALAFHPNCGEEVGLSLLKAAEQSRSRQHLVVVAVSELPAPSRRPQLRPVA